MTTPCKNCNDLSNASFCPNCGQKKDLGRFTLKHLFEEAIHAFTHADKGFLLLLKNLIIRPGTVASDYIVFGKRKRHFNIFTFFVIITTIAAFVERKDLLLKEELFQVDNEYGFQLNVFTKLLYLVEIPILAFCFWLLFKGKSKLYFSEYTVLSMTLLSVNAIYLIFIKALNYVFTSITRDYISIDDHWTFALILGLLGFVVLYDFHKKLGYRAIFQSILSGVLFLLIHTLIIIFVIWSVLRDFTTLGILELFGIQISGS